MEMPTVHSKLKPRFSNDLQFNFLDTRQSDKVLKRFPVKRYFIAASDFRFLFD